MLVAKVLASVFLRNLKKYNKNQEMHWLCRRQWTNNVLLWRF